MKPYAYDSNGSSELLSYDLKKTGNNLFITIKTPYLWLNSSERVYPVIIDPPVSVINANEDVYTSYVADGPFPPLFEDSYQTFIKFSLTSIPENGTIEKAELKLNKYYDNGLGSAKEYAYNCSNEWTESSSGSDFASMPCSYTGNYTTITSTNGYYAWNVTSALDGWYNSNKKNFTIRLNRTITSSNPSVSNVNFLQTGNGAGEEEGEKNIRYNSSEAATNKPYLRVTYMPEGNATNQSKIVNDGSTNSSIYIFMKVQSWDGSSWSDDDIVYDESVLHSIPIGNLVKLDALFNGKWDVSMACCGAGTYRVYAAATNKSNTVLENYNGVPISNTYEFTIS